MDQCVEAQKADAPAALDLVAYETGLATRYHDALVGAETALAFYGGPRCRMYSDIKSGSFPAPKFRGRWVASDLNAWLIGQIAAKKRAAM